MEADLQRYYQMDLVDLYRGQVSIRKISVLVEALPDDSATTKAQRRADGDPLVDWTLTDILLGKQLEMHSGNEIVPRTNDKQARGKPATPQQREIKTVSVREAMGFVNKPPSTFGQEIEGTQGVES